MKWLIGANPSCDLVVDAPGVSSKHCEISSTNNGVVLSDLNSTNGTWVNAKRISAATVVKSEDSIRLGLQTPLAMQQIQRLVKCGVVRIGRDSDNDAVLADENVSGQHARLLIDGDQITLIDLVSSNGTAIGSPENKTPRAVVSPNDDVYFASNRFRISDLLQHTATAATRASPNWYRHPAISAAAVVVAVLLISVAVFRNGGTEPEAPEAADGATVTLNSVAEPVEIERTANERLQQTLFAVVVRTAATEPGLRVGTAWAVADRELATSGNVVLFLKQSKDEFPIIVVQNVGDGQEWPVIDSIVHTMCRKNADRIKELGNQIEKLEAELEALVRKVDGDDQTEAAVPESDRDTSERLAEQILKLDNEWFVSAEDMFHFDVGLLLTNKSLADGSETVELTIAAKSPSRLSAVTVNRAAFPHDQSIVIDPSPILVPKLECTVEAFARREKDGVLRPVLRCSADHVQQNWLGSPVVNSSGEVVGLYSRPTPSLTPDTPPAGDRCDIISVERLNDLLSQSLE